MHGKQRKPCYNKAKYATKRLSFKHSIISVKLSKRVKNIWKWKVKVTKGYKERILPPFVGALKHFNGDLIA